MSPVAMSAAKRETAPSLWWAAAEAPRCWVHTNAVVRQPLAMISISAVTVAGGGRIRFVKRLERGVGAIDTSIARKLEVTPFTAEQMRDACRDQSSSDEWDLVATTAAG